MWFDALTFGYKSNIDCIGEHEMEQFQGLLPHFAKSIEIGRAFSHLRARYRAVLTVLDRVRVGLAIALPNGEVIVSNAEADRILAMGDGLSLGRDLRFRCTDPDKGAKLNDAIAVVSATAKGENSQTGRVITVPRKSDGTPFVVDIVPLNDSQNELGINLRGALIILIDPNHVPYLRTERFTTLYALTEAENSICNLLLTGHSPREISEIRGTSLVTVKNQIASVFSKSGARNRSELILLIVRVLPPIT